MKRRNFASKDASPWRRATHAPRTECRLDEGACHVRKLRGLGCRGFLDRTDHHHSRVVDQHIGARGTVDDGFDVPLNRAILPNVHLDELDTGQHGCLAQFAHGAEHPAAPRHEHFRSDAPDARGCARDDNN